MAESNTLKLEAELVPEPTWYINLRSIVTDEMWDFLRKKTYRDAFHCCSICGAKGRTEAHEIWGYDDENHLQFLSGITCLCSYCHSLKHLALLRIRHEKEELNIEDYISHFCKVNSCTREVFDKHLIEADNTFNSRAGFDWKVVVPKWLEPYKRENISDKVVFFNF